MSNDTLSADSEWSGGALYLYRIHLCIWESNKYAMLKDYSNQLASLFCLHRELVAQMKDNKDNSEVAKAERLYKECERIISFKKYDVKLLVWKLYEYEKFLKNILKERKMDIPRGQDTSRAIL